MAIHPTALVDPGAEIHEDVEIGPYSLIGPEVTIGRGTAIGAYVTVERWTEIGERNRIYNYSCLGSPSQDRKAKGERSFVRIGHDNTIREYVTINRATGEDQATVVGDGNCLMAYAHVAHNCRLGSHTVLSNYAGLAGKVVVEDYALLGGFAGVHQFCRIGRHAIVGGLTKVSQDVPPFCIADGHPARLFGANTIGLRRHGFPESEIRAIKRAFRLLFRAHLPFEQALNRLAEKFDGSPSVRSLVEFCRATARGVVHPPRGRP